VSIGHIARKGGAFQPYSIQAFQLAGYFWQIAGMVSRDE